MNLTNLAECVAFLEREKDLVRIRKTVDPDLEMAHIHNRVFAADGPAVFYESVKGSRFPAVSNLFGTRERALKLLGPALERVSRLIRYTSEPAGVFKKPFQGMTVLPSLVHALPRKQKYGPAMECLARIRDLPMIRCWPGDGGAFILLPQVLSQDPVRPGILKTNIGMYRVQMSGNDYLPDRELGLHYQIHRGIGNHHAAALEMGKPLRVSIFIGGPPAHTLAAVMPLPEGMPEVAFAGALAGRRFRYCMNGPDLISADADFCITGKVVPGRTKPEGPFGDHLGYYSLQHEFPVFEVEAVYHRRNAIWPFTVVGRPPREDTVFGKLIHEMTGPAIPASIPGVTAVHAVDAAGVHPLLLAKARERYVPYEVKQPRELLTHANAILGTGQLSLAKYLLICSHEDNPGLDINDEPAFFTHFLQRINFATDLHFQTSTTMDTLDYSSDGLNHGSKLIMAAAGKRQRSLLTRYPSDVTLPSGFHGPRVAGPGILVVQASDFVTYQEAEAEMDALGNALGYYPVMQGFPLVVAVNDAAEASSDFATFLWITFSRSNPSHDIYGAGSFIRFKHWGCRGPLIIDARIKPFHAPLLVPDPAMEKQVDLLGQRGNDLHGII